MKRFLPLTLASFLLASPFAALAASLNITPSAASAGQEFSVPVRFMAQGEQVNAVEGTIRIPSGLSVTRISTGGSALTLWPVLPSFSRSNDTVSFAGGVPGPLPADGSPLLFTLYLQAATPGTYSLAPEDVSAFRADGTGTRIAVTARLVPVTAGEGEVPTEDMRDRTAPRNVVAVLGSDASLFGGAPFVYTYGSDEGSGIVAYQAKEGWFAPYADAGHYYVLADRQVTQPVWIRALDAAGNTRTVHVPGTGDVLYYGAFALLPLALIILMAFFVYRRRIRPIS